ncbi:LysR family transcriptional regulator [Nocardioides donggukensis]|uniref:LysR family transcriptional regulator n=1 Tax=Nocardioides donggukensis TaxID=2774019 RepID=A0A927K3G3_9ACTN|nr:LysR family transcriptional regulator [Nocardioides donggukensis]MBD8868028.1 LysR family transcriptional regulator [Nocardioides donggukensis]
MTNFGFTLVQLRYFAAAAELGSMTAASQELMVSQSAVSTAVAQLEKELGVQLLLRRHARGLTLTPAGEEFYRELRNYLVHTAELAEVARTAGQALVGDLSIGCFTTLAPFELPSLLAACEEEHPGIRVSVVEDEHAVLKQALRSGRCELALMYGYDLEDDIDHVRVGVAAPYVLVAKGHRLGRRKRVALSELADEPMVLLDLPHSGQYLERVVESAGFHPRVRHRTAGFETARALVAHGQGWSVLNQRPATNTTYDGSEVVALEISDEVEPLEVVLASMKGIRRTGRAQAFIRSSIRATRGRASG